MSHHGQSRAIEIGERHPGTTRRMFKARIVRFDDPADRALMDELSAWVEDAYCEELVFAPQGLEVRWRTFWPSRTFSTR